MSLSEPEAYDKTAPNKNQAWVEPSFNTIMRTIDRYASSFLAPVQAAKAAGVFVDLGLGYLVATKQALPGFGQSPQLHPRHQAIIQGAWITRAARSVARPNLEPYSVAFETGWLSHVHQVLVAQPPSSPSFGG
jgi:hypothetical protein